MEDMGRATAENSISRNPGTREILNLRENLVWQKKPKFLNFKYDLRGEGKAFHFSINNHETATKLLEIFNKQP